jgi:hypothetical protein
MSPLLKFMAIVLGLTLGSVLGLYAGWLVWVFADKVLG